MKNDFNKEEFVADLNKLAKEIEWKEFAIPTFKAPDTPCTLIRDENTLISGGVQLKDGSYWSTSDGTPYPDRKDILERWFDGKEVTDEEKRLNKRID